MSQPPYQRPTGYEVRSHRAPPTPATARLAQAGNRLGVGALLIAAVAVGGLINSYTPDTDRRERPFVAEGAPGNQVSTRAFDATVLGVRGAAKVIRFRKEHQTGGVWVLVKVRVRATTEPTGVRYAAVTDGRGRTFDATDRVTQPLVGGRTLQPGVPVQAEIVFEVPRDAVGELTVKLAAKRVDHRMDDMVEVPLPIEPGQVDGWLADPKATELTDAEVVR